MKDTDRIQWIDVAKGIGIIFVILGHTIAYDYCHSIYAFHMPLFFFLMGLVYNKKKYSSFRFLVQTKMQQLLLPWLLIYLFSLTVCLCIPMWRINLSIHHMLVELYTANSNNIQNSSIWFLLCSFFVFIVVFFLNKLPRTKWIFLLLCFVAFGLLYQRFCLIWVSEHIIQIPLKRLPFKIDTAFIAAVFFVVGIEIKPFLSIIYNSRFIIVLGGFISFIALSYINGDTNINLLTFGRYSFLYYFVAFLGIFLIVWISKKITDSHYLGLKKLFTFYGRNSLIIFGFQSLFIRLYMLICNVFFTDSLMLYGKNPIEHQLGSFFIVTFIVTPLWVFVISQAKRKVLRYE